ncbi:hypothetical protein HXX76_007618 [Chlamydomonas incerta]|uniref:Protein kinase domain-containing protein n=1 Tax=Chlamydomonas incerta TaxID=51695 RepID=A0A835W2D3_CHLIN|nr:hypothetical protein HXX76_007618 [Chlamydomonas incerta]|eukprot:KAG2434728.1 hypothetical protein HXX76_007618 [Chlamydomonas incerta]
MLYSIGPGYFFTLFGVGVYFDHGTLGPIFRAVRLSPGGRLVFERCFVKRLVGVSYEDGIRNAQSLPRPVVFPGNQTIEIVGARTFLTCEPAPRVVDRIGWMIDYAGSMPTDTTMASQGLFFGGYDLWVHYSYFLNEYFANSTCLATRPGSECLAILLDEIEANKARQAAQQQAAADSGGSGSDGNTATIVVAVVVPVGTVLLAALNNGGGVFMGVDGEKDLPVWLEAAHHEADDLGDVEQPASGLAGTGPGRGADDLTTGTAADGTRTGTGSTTLQPPLELSACQLQIAGPVQGSQQHAGKQQTAAGQLQLSSGKQAGEPTYVGRDRSMHDPSQRASRATAARLKPALTRAFEGAAEPDLMSTGPDGPTDKQLTEYALSGSASGTVNIKVPDHVPSGDEVVAELGALVKELRGNVNHVAIVLEGVLGHGSFGTVYKGTWQGLSVAIKTVVFSASQESRKHALKEAALCQSISHPNVIATYASELQPIGALPSSTFGTPILSGNTPPASGTMSHLNLTDWRLYIIQEFADGGPLGGLYGHRALWLSPGVVNLAAILPLALGIARALEHLHSKRIVHGDLNPNNVLLKRDPGEPSGYAVKVGDFGLSVMLPTDRTHLSNIRMGTMFYICPAVACKGQVGPAADVFSLGVILWELYHGRRAGVRTQEGPRYCSNFPAFPPSCPEVYKATTLQCLQRQPQNRPPATTVVGALEHLLANLGPAQSEWLAAAAMSAANAKPATPPFAAPAGCDPHARACG